jgi:hypothetical protein
MDEGDTRCMDEEAFYDVRQDVAVLKAQRQEAEKALAIATKALEHAQALSNEWRGTVQDVINKCVTRDELNSLLKAVYVEIESLKAARNEASGKSSGISASWGVILAVTTVGLLAVGAIVSLAGMLLRGR